VANLNLWRNVPVLLDEAFVTGGMMTYTALLFKGRKYSIGGCVYLEPESRFILGRPLPKKDQRARHEVRMILNVSYVR